MHNISIHTFTSLSVGSQFGVHSWASAIDLIIPTVALHAQKFSHVLSYNWESKSKGTSGA